MLRSSLVLLLLSAVPLAGERIALRPVPLADPCENAIVHEPLVVFERTGGTLLGPVDLHLTVSSSGTARIVDLSDPFVPRGARAYVDLEAVVDLARDLERAGAFLMCDPSTGVTDVPLNTLTILRPGTEGRAHTHSWWLPEGTNGAIEDRIDQFIAEVFPEF
ncbi:MAG: hypothetical protein JNK02_00640 [Planctomycetes bacterium]|nr:hypothetical protein [Planctomycetota bacterium]